VITITAKLNADDVLGKLNSIQETQAPFAMMLTLNNLANAVQKAQREHISSTFKINRPWVLQGIYIDPMERASKSNWSVIVRVQENRDFLNKFEEGGQKVPSKGKYLAIPNRRVLGNGVITKGNALNIKNLDIKRMANGQMEGKANTFMIQGKRGKDTWLILQRVNLAEAYTPARTSKQQKAREKKRKGLSINTGNRLLYTLLRRTPVAATLQFVDIANKVVNEQFATEVSKAFDQAISTMK